MGLPIDRVCFYHGEKIKTNAFLIRFYRCHMKYDQLFSGWLISKDYNYTLYNYLTKTEEELFHDFKSNYRNEIRRVAKEEYKIDWFDSQSLLDNEQYLTEFEKLHAQMLIDKNKTELVRNYNHMQVMKFIEQDSFILTRAEAPNSGVVYHAYLCDGKTAILQHSCSDFREGTVNRTSAGRLNKFLHWEDMRHFKQLGYQIYDWGNTFDKGPEYSNGIDKFKAGFGGESVKLVSAFKANSLIGIAVVFARNMGGKYEK